MKDLNLFSGLVSAENLNLGYGLIEENKEMTDEEIKIDLIQKAQITNKIRTLISDLFENFNSIAEEVIEIILNKHAEMKVEELKKQNLEKYNRINEIFKQDIKNQGIDYYYFNFADFILMFSRINKYYLEFNLKIDFTESPTVFMLSIYGDEEQIKKMAQFNEYELKLKPYAYKFQHYLDEFNGKPKLKTIIEEPKDQKEVLINTNSVIQVEENENYWKPFQYSELDVENVIHWPPYVEYHNDKDDKYQRYETDDSYHECNVKRESDEACGKCSIFRNIDKLRTIYDSVDKMIKISYLVQEKILNFILLKRNHVDYAQKLTFKSMVKSNWNIFNFKKQMEHIFTIRNFYGETVAYYFLWLFDYVRWLSIPTLVGIVMLFISKFAKNGERVNRMPYQVLIIIYGAFIALWASLFLSQWKQKETLYNYFWGTENYKHLELDSEGFVPDGTKELIFNVRFPYVSKWKQIGKYCFTFFFLFIMLFVTIALIVTLFYLKGKLIEWYADSIDETGIGMGVASLNAIQIKLMNYLYTYFATKLNNWENHQKDYQKSNFLAIKLIMFDFVNSFFAIYYIAFIKSQGGLIFPDKCVVDCMSEIEMQLYTTFGINLCFNVLEIGLPWFSFYKHKKSLEKIREEKKIENSIDLQSTSSKYEILPHTIEHQLICEPYDELIGEYSEVLIQFGYVCLFSVAAPLTPLLVFVLLYLEKFVDTYKLFFLVRMNIKDGSNGLENYNTIIRVIIYLGLVTNIGIVVFTDKEFVVQDNLYRVIAYAGIVLFMFIVFQIAHWNIIPSWFNLIEEIKELYYKKYFSRDEKALPHFDLIRKIEKRKKATKGLGLLL